MNPITIRTVCRDVLQACVDAYSQSGAPTIPARAYVTHGQPMWVGEQLVVYSGGLQSTRPFPLARSSAVKSTVIPSALVTIEVVRDCWPQPKVSAASKSTPHPSRYADAAERAMLDAATIFSHIAQLAVTGTLLPNVPASSGTADIGLGSMVPVGPIGTKFGYRWPLTVKISTDSTVDEGDPLVWLSGEPIEWSPGDLIDWET